MGAGVTSKIDVTLRIHGDACRRVIPASSEIGSVKKHGPGWVEFGEECIIAAAGTFGLRIPASNCCLKRPNHREIFLDDGTHSFFRIAAEYSNCLSKCRLSVRHMFRYM